MPALVDGHIPNNKERKLLWLPMKLRYVNCYFR